VPKPPISSCIDSGFCCSCCCCCCCCFASKYPGNYATSVPDAASCLHGS
jgi:hypothetical protein